MLPRDVDSLNHKNIHIHTIPWYYSIVVYVSLYMDNKNKRLIFKKLNKKYYCVTSQTSFFVILEFSFEIERITINILCVYKYVTHNRPYLLQQYLHFQNPKNTPS